MWNRQEKSKARNYSLPTKVVKSSIWLPGMDAIDVLTAYENNLLSPEGTHILAERDPIVVEKIRKLTKKLPVKIFQGELHDLIIREPIDYIHIDLNGQLDYKMADWISGLQFSRHAEFCITVQYALRNSAYMQVCNKLFTEDGEFRNIHEFFFKNFQIKDSNVSLYMGILHCLLRRYKFARMQPYRYRDTIDMILFRFNRFERRKTFDYPDLSYKLGLMLEKSQFEENPMRKKNSVKKVSKKVLSQRALKAWETRNKKKLEELQSLLTLKEKRSNAARKAWVTRKSMERS